VWYFFQLTFIGKFGNGSSGSVLEKTLVKFCNENFASDQLLAPILGARLASWDFQHSSKMSS
jgi:hypothetical protein